MPITTTGLRLFFRKKLYVVLGIAACIPFFIMLLGIVAPHMVQSVNPADLGEEVSSFLHVSGTNIYVYLARWEWVFLFLFTVLAGGGLIANDLRANALEIYFSHPLTLLDYFLGKISVLLAILLALTFVPCLILWFVDVGLTDREGYLLSQIHLLPRMFAASLLMTVPYALMILAASALSSSARNAMLLFVGVERMSSILGFVLSRALEDPRYHLISVMHNIQRLMAQVLAPDVRMVGLVSSSEHGGGIPMSDMGSTYPALVLMGLCGLCVLVVFRKVRGVEVISS